MQIKICKIQNKYVKFKLKFVMCKLKKKSVKFK